MRFKVNVGLLIVVLAVLAMVACSPGAADITSQGDAGFDSLTAGTEGSSDWLTVEECISGMQQYFTAPEWNGLNTRGIHLGEKGCRDIETLKDMSPQIRLAILWTSILRAQAIGLNLEPAVEQNTRCRTLPDRC